MKCRSCGKSITRSVNRMCIDCYLDHNLPTKIDEIPWVFISSFSRKGLREGKFDEELASAITSMCSTISTDKEALVLRLDDRRISVPLTVEKIDALAQKSGILIGKWLIYRSDSEIDTIWKTIAKSTINGELGTSAKVSTEMNKSKRHVICVYTANYLDLKDVMRVREKLQKLGFGEEICYNLTFTHT